MTMLDNKLFADYESNHIVMTYPSMHAELEYYKKIKHVYINLSKILSHNKILQSFIVPKDFKESKSFLHELNQHVNIIKYDCDDIWIRDYYPKIYLKNGSKYKLDFDYNAYGEKYPFRKDDYLKYTLNQYNTEFDLSGFVLEGGNLEFSKRGVVISNSRCLKKNNYKCSAQNVLDKLLFIKNKLSFNELHMIEVGNIQGDDTNGHIDNLVRFIDDENIVYFASNDKQYINFDIAKELEHQLLIIKRKSKIIKNIFPIFHNEEDTFIYNDNYYPYSKLNFVITSNCIIFPSIKKNQSYLSNWVEKIASSKKKYIINCEGILIENGGLHCLSANI